MNPRETILCVDDEEGVLVALRQQLLERFGHECIVVTASSGDEALALIAELERDEEQLAIVIADQVMPGMKGADLLQVIGAQWPATMKVLLTGQAGLEAVTYAVNHAGLHQYVGKPWDPMQLRLVVEGLLRQYRLASENLQLVETLSTKNQALLELNRELEAKIHARTHELAEANSRLGQLAVTDGLTGLFNHRHFHERLALEVERAQRSGGPLSLIMFDVDHFKHYNDHHGHPAGDEVLRQLGRLLGEGRRANDVVARYGGEEFAIVLIDTTKFAAAKIADKLRERIADHRFEFAAEQPLGRLSVSAGVATFTDDAADAAALVRAADGALYAAKRAGRDRVVLASDATRTITGRFPPIKADQALGDPVGTIVTDDEIVPVG